MRKNLENNKERIIGVADTTFSRVNMHLFVEDAVKNAINEGSVDFNLKIERYTVPGIKDLPVACKLLFEKYSADIVIALGMVGGEKIDKQCSHEASTSIQQVMLLRNKHILEVFVHMDEAYENLAELQDSQNWAIRTRQNIIKKLNEKKLFSICRDRAYKHTLNALALLKGKNELTQFAGHGRRQGANHAGQIKF
ncbi:riboflavin synthase [Candidatus Woesearchaeota archaeon]|nr:riboflavin synthase [Candidatus Woesearchaeota archaeon]